MITKVISGGQIGADIAGVRAAHKLGIATGGCMPKGFKTKAGARPEFAEAYGMIEHESDQYPPRTEWNVQNSDGTIRCAFNFNSPGELCTLKFLKKHNKPYLDIRAADLCDDDSIRKACIWARLNKISVLNVAGNAKPILEPYVTQFIAYLLVEFNRLPSDLPRRCGI
jgi:hypothetical protein